MGGFSLAIFAEAWYSCSRRRQGEMDRTYIAIDLKSFYASAECVDRGLDPLTTNLVVADTFRTDKTICLAVSPSLKAYGVPGRPRLFEVVQKVQLINAERRAKAPHREFTGTSSDDTILRADPEKELTYITAIPRMARYVEYSTKIYAIYLKYIAPEDILVYSIDEVMMDVTNYLALYNTDAHGLAMRMIQDVLRNTGITATAGIGTNLYLCKVAMDIVAKHAAPDKNGVRIAELDEMSYRRLLWEHTPLTDFWRVGRGYVRRLEKLGLHTMGDIARCSIGKPGSYYNEDLLYKEFGIGAELLIDHAWGWEPCTMEAINAYRPSNNSLGSGQVLQSPYPYDKARLVTREMADALSLDLAKKGLVADQIVLTVGYDIENLQGRDYNGPVTTDVYGRSIPKAAHGSENLPKRTSSTRLIVSAALSLFDRIVNQSLLVRRVTISANHVVEDRGEEAIPEQMSLFTTPEEIRARQVQEEALEKERKIQGAILGIQEKFGKNALLRGFNLEKGATTRERNEQIGGHRK